MPSHFAYKSAYRTAERDAVMYECYPTTMGARDIMARLNALPGDLVVQHILSRYATILRLKRPKAFFQSASHTSYPDVKDSIILGDEPAELDVVIGWAERNKIDLSSGSRQQQLAAINEARRKFGLPGFIFKTPRMRHAA